MNVMVFDTETTGLKAGGGDRIIEIAMLTYDSASRALVERYVQRIDPQRAIGAEAQAVHGIGYEQLAGCPKFAEVAAAVHARLAICDLAVAHNLDFDASFLLCELDAAGLLLPSLPSVCTMRQCRWACPDGKLPKLQELAFALGVPYDPALAHAADYDAEVTIECFWRSLDRGFITLPHGVAL